jgi:hypothetical protein
MQSKTAEDLDWAGWLLDPPDSNSLHVAPTEEVELVELLIIIVCNGEDRKGDD